MNWIDLITSLLGLTCVFLAGRNSKYNFWVGYLYTAALFVLFWRSHSLSMLLLQPVSLAINVLGHWRWTHPREDERSAEDGKSLKVSMLTWPQRLLAIATVLMIIAVWGLLLDHFFPADPQPYLGCAVTVLILMAQLLSSMKKWDCWIAWLFVNCTQLVLHLLLGNYFMMAVSGLYLVNGLWSLYSWMKLYKKNG